MHNTYLRAKMLAVVHFDHLKIQIQNPYVIPVETSCNIYFSIKKSAVSCGESVGTIAQDTSLHYPQNFID